MVGKDKIRINATLRRASYARLQKICDDSGLTISEIFQTLLDGLLEEMDKPAPVKKARRKAAKKSEGVI